MKNRGRLWVIAGLLLLAAALSLTGYNLYDGRRAGQSARLAVSRLEAYLPPEAPTESPAQPLAGRTAPADYVLCPGIEMPVQTVDGIGYIGVLEIPALELELPVISQWSYPNLKTAPCRYSGSAYLDNLILCGHNYAAHFGKLKLLRQGDAVTLTDMEGNRFVYTVASLETLGPADIEELESGDWDLTLFTCTVGGQNRVAVRCEKGEGEG